MKSYVFWGWNMAHLCLEWYIFRNILEYKFKAHILFSISFSKFVPRVKECGTKCYQQTGHMCQYNTSYLLCQLSKQSYRNTLTFCNTLAFDEWNGYINAHLCYVIRIIFTPVTLIGNWTKVAADLSLPAQLRVRKTGIKVSEFLKWKE
jgi:hypothetical protein